MARRDEGEYPSWVFDRGATKPDGFLLENPPGGRSFGCGRRWLGRHSPLRGCSALAALPTSKIPRRSTSRNFQTGSRRDDAHLIRREPEREVAGVMLDEEADEPLMRAERRAMDTQGRLVKTSRKMRELLQREIGNPTKQTFLALFSGFNLLALYLHFFASR